MKRCFRARPRTGRAGATRPAFSLIELLVVIAVIGLLAALVLPAVQAARESGRRMYCANNLHQLGLGLHSYTSSFGVMPSGQGGRGQSIHVSILPYIDQAVLYNAINLDAGVDNEEVNGTIAGVRVTAFMCPSDPAIWVAQRSGWTSYAGNTGDGLYIGRSNGIFSQIEAPANVALGSERSERQRVLPARHAASLPRSCTSIQRDKL